jgi:Tfp pilus assembly protein PilO
MRIDSTFAKRALRSSVAKSTCAQFLLFSFCAAGLVNVEENALGIKTKRVSSMLRPQSPSDEPLAAILASIKSLARSDGLTDEEIEAELAVYNAERGL